MEALFPMVVYNALPYKFPLFATQPVVRIPIAGPEPYNTLAVIRARVPGSFQWATGDLYREEVYIPTPLILRGYDPLRDSQKHVQHSTMASIQMMQAAAGDGPQLDDWNSYFTIAIDTIQLEASISSTGQVFLAGSVASQMAGRVAASAIEISSWILCWEPPDPNPWTEIVVPLEEAKNPGVTDLMGDE